MAEVRQRSDKYILIYCFLIVCMCFTCVLGCFAMVHGGPRRVRQRSDRGPTDTNKIYIWIYSVNSFYIAFSVIYFLA